MSKEPPCKKVKKENYMTAVCYSKHDIKQHEYSYFKSIYKRSYGYKLKLLCDPLSRNCSEITALKLYKLLKLKHKYQEQLPRSAVYNIEFCPDDKYALAACASSDVMLFDPCSHSKIKTFTCGQKDGVNAITFIDERTFATCSDDSSIKLWDIRNTNENIKTLTGHTGWVKNMNFNSSTKQLITSAFDETLRLWDLDKFQPDNLCSSQVILEVPYMTRSNFLKNFAKLVISTTSGFLLVFDHFDAKTIKEEYQEMLSLYMPHTDPFVINQKQFSKAKNKVIALTDYPNKSKPFCFGSTQISPNGNFLLSRYTTTKDTEWTVLHDISSSKEKSTRLLGYAEEPDVASEYIKEPSFSPDSRVVCSPFGNAVRILGIDQSNLQNDTYLSYKRMYEISFLPSHRQPILCTKFANTKTLLMTGCMAGQVSFYEPKIF